MGVDGIHPEKGITISASDEIQSKQTYLAMSEKTYAVADSSKIGRVSFRSISCGEKEVSVVTDHKASPEICAEIEKSGICLLYKMF